MLPSFNIWYSSQRDSAEYLRCWWSLFRYSDILYLAFRIYDMILTVFIKFVKPTIYEAHSRKSTYGSTFWSWLNHNCEGLNYLSLMSTLIIRYVTYNVNKKYFLMKRIWFWYWFHASYAFWCLSFEAENFDCTFCTINQVILTWAFKCTYSFIS